MSAIDFTGIRIMVIGDLMRNAGSVERISPEAAVPGLENLCKSQLQL
jgi:bifunctional ADP-heptose synthase (sugar kinase/adenylyltransferase)